MKIKLIGFRSHVDSQFTFTENSITLLKGPSGAGKSTILAAISWVLYGSMQHVYNNNGVNKCSVTLEFDRPQMIIYRQKRPELLRLTLFDKEEIIYEDQVAQQIINQSFGNKEVWSSCCYLAQGSRSYLLSASNADKTDLLNNLSFTAEDPDIYLQRIEAELQRVNQEFVSHQTLFTKDCNSFSEEINRLHLDMTLFLSPEDQQELKEKINQEKERYQLMKKKHLLDQQARGAKSSLEKNRDRLLKSLALLSSEISKTSEQTFSQPSCSQEGSQEESQEGSQEGSLDLLGNLSQRIIQLEKEEESLQEKGSSLPGLLQASRIRKELTHLQKEIDHLPKEEISEEDLEEDHLTQLTIQKQKYEESFALARRLNIAYEQETIEEEIRSINQNLENQSKIKVYLSIAEIRDKLNRLSNEGLSANEGGLSANEAVLPSLEKEIQLLRDKISRLKMAVGILKCPYCTKPVRMIKGALTPSDTNPPSPARIGDCEKRLQDLTENRQRILEIQPLKQKLEMLMKMVDELPSVIPKPLTSIEVTRLKQRVSDLLRITLLRKPLVDPQELRRIKNRKRNREELLQRKEQLEKEIEQIPKEEMEIDPITHQKKTDQVKRELTQLRNQKEKYLILNQQIEEVNLQLAEIVIDEGLDQEIQELTQEIKTLEKELSTAETIDIFLQRQKELEKNKSDLEEEYTYLTNLQRLKTIALEVEGHALQETIDSINNVLSDITSTLFEKDREMLIRLSPFKQLKTKDRVKPMINLLIKYGSGEYDNINQLSGGEGDRISLAVTLALSLLNSCPLLLLDESMASLDADLKELSLKAIREIARNKTVIIINHEGTEGHYDQVLQIED